MNCIWVHDQDELVLLNLSAIWLYLFDANGDVGPELNSVTNVPVIKRARTRVASGR
jgi:hypothetical protein